jgi:hypothetical protein
MTRREMVVRLLEEGLSRNTLINATDNQLMALCERMLGEGVTKVATADTKTQDQLKQQKKPFELYEKTKKLTTKQLSSLDKNENGKIDKEDFKLLKKGKTTVVTKGVKKTDKKTPLKKSKESVKPKDVIKGKTKKDISSISENSSIKKWVLSLSENKYHSFTSKNEIMELIKTKLNEVETASIPMPSTKARKGHNGVPEFMSYDAIVDSDTTTKPITKPDTKPVTKPTPFGPGTRENPGPSANTKPITKPDTKPTTKPVTKPTPFGPGTKENPGPSAIKSKK